MLYCTKVISFLLLNNYKGVGPHQVLFDSLQLADDIPLEIYISKEILLSWQDNKYVLLFKFGYFYYVIEVSIISNIIKVALAR